MGSISKSFSLLLILILATSVLIMAKPAFAQSTEPSPPNFTVQIPNAGTIQIVIENQAFTNTSSVNSVVYYYRVKDHNSDSWIKYGDYTLQSNSDTTIISIPPLPGMPTSILSTPQLDSASLLDFQVQAVTGFYSVTWKPGYMPDAPTQFQSGNGYEETTFNPAESSDWSPTQTLTLPASSDSVTQTSTPSPLAPTRVPTQAPTSNPAIPEIPIIAIPLFLFPLSVALILRLKKPSSKNA